MQLAFRGRPSKGCTKCRQRKVKCDEGHPNCERCIKGGFDCVYRDEFDLLLRNQTSETAVKAQKKWRSRAKKPNQHPTSAPSPSSSTSSNSPRSATLQLSIDTPVSIDINDAIYEVAAKRFVFDFVVPDGTQIPKNGFASFVPDLVKETPDETCLWHAFRATSLANFAARSKSTQAAELASKEYGRAIKLLGPSVADPALSPPLETLAAVSLLGLYELLSSPFLTHSGSWQAHVNGSCAILNSVYERGGRDLESLSELFLHIIIQMLINRMTLGKPPAVPLKTFDAFIRPKTMASQVLHLMYKACTSIAEWHAMELNCADLSMLLIAAAKMIEDCDNMDAELCQWLSERAPIWQEDIRTNKPENIPHWLQTLYSLPGAPSTLLVSNNLLISQRMVLIRGTRIQMHMHALNAVDVLITCSQTDEELATWLGVQERFELRTMDVINEMLSAIFGNLTLPMRNKPAPKTLDEVPTMRICTLMWPLYRASMALARRETMAQLDTRGSRLWAREALVWARDDIGLKKCVAFVDNIDGKLGLTFC